MNPRQMMAIVVAAFLGTAIAVAVILVIARPPGHEELFERQTEISNQINYVACLLLVPAENRVPEYAASCLTATEN